MGLSRMTGELLKTLQGRRILVVEDQYLVADEMRRMVVQMGGEVVGPVSRAGPALDLLESDRIDLALLDINLGAEDAYPLAAELVRRDIRFIFATGCEPWVAPEAFRDVPRLDKPVTSGALSDAIQRLGQLPASTGGGA